MTFSLEIPLDSGDSIKVDLACGSALFVLGANGTGKSTLLQRFFARHSENARRISAHRQTWFHHGAVSITGQQRTQLGTNATVFDAQPASRWMENQPEQRPNMALYDLVEAHNRRAREISEAIDAGDVETAKNRARTSAPLAQLNYIFRASALPITLTLHEQDTLRASKSGGPQYSIAELSDGERNVLLLAASVLTAPSGSMLLIDEPERHIHRAISAPLISQLLHHRADCAFVVSTHDVDLCIDTPATSILLTRSCSLPEPGTITWSADLVEMLPGLDTGLLGDILGARRTVLFVEGSGASLDASLYSLLFPSVSVIPRLTCRDVELAVRGVRGTQGIHWARAFGIIDGDGRTPTEIANCAAEGLFALPRFSVESLYYDPEIIRRVAVRQCGVIGGDPSKLVDAAFSTALERLSVHRRRLCVRVVEKVVRERLLQQLPGRDRIERGELLTLSVDPNPLIADEEGRFMEALDAGDFGKLVHRYPLRETTALTDVAFALGFNHRRPYEAAVRKLVSEEADALEHLRRCFGDLATALVSR